MRTAVAAAGGLLLAVSLLSSSADAVGGYFQWRGPKGRLYSLENPPENKCYSMQQEARAARNFTEKPIAIYQQKGCKGEAHRLEPKQSAPEGQHFQSVIFNPR
ncbi:hypothetical protein [Streptomyces mashuensis]|uniref:hypothetical protein n=1 Tax=Streptomyces mashuensis TaxID=33904 RepID=UPI001E55BB63|nr:hypothetical protein [Streptomyces mashuensis]